MPSNKFQSPQSSQKSNPETQGFKQVSFQVLHCLHRSNQNIHNAFYYILMVVEFMQIFYYITHPFLPYYQNSHVMNNIHQFLKYFVFNEFLADDSNFYRIAIPLFFGYVVIQIILLMIIVREIKAKKLINEVKKIHLAANLMFIILNSVLTIPFFGMSLNVLYCQTESNIYTLGQACYQGAHIGYCFLAAFIILALVVQWGINWYIYYNKNPFGTDFLAKYENNAVLGKFLIKIIPIIYLSVDMKLNYVNVFTFGITACMCGYLFFFRLFAFHDYNERNFYVVLFMEVILAWFSINNIILSYLDTERKAGGLFQSFLCSLLIGALAIQVEEENYKKIFMEGMEAEKVKKQNIEKFLYRLIYMFTHSQTDDQKTHISTIFKILNSKLKDSSSDPSQNTSKIGKKVQKKFYSFLSRFVTEYLQSNWNVMLMSVNCNLLIMDERFSYAFHQSLELSSKKISIVEQLMMYRFRRHQRYDKEKLDTSKKQGSNIFMMYYDFNQNLMKLQEEIATCTYNNLDYWEEVCESSPSIYKIRNLAQKYEHHQQLIDHYYTKIYDTFPNNKLTIKTYIEFLMYVGVNVNNLAKARERYQQAEENIKKTKELQRDSGNLIQMGENQNLAFVSIQTSQMSLATMTNCNTEFKKMLGYEKNELIDKKVNKIMPKAFSQFHDTLVRNHIQKKQRHEKNKVERIVYALSKDNFLVEVVLFTKVNYKTVGQKGTLELIGFLKKIEDPNKAVIILETKSCNIIGANAGFSTLIDNGIGSSQFANSQIRICTLIPNLNLSLVEEGKSQQTNLVFSSSVIVTKSGLNLEVKKKILIEVQQVREYANSKQKFAYLALKEIEADSSSVQMQGGTALALAEIVNMEKKQTKANQRKVKVSTSQVSIMQDQFSSSMNTFDSETIKQSANTPDRDFDRFHMIERKKQQYLKNQHLDILSYILWIGLILFIFITIGLLIYSIVLNLEMLQTSMSIKGQVKNSYVLTYESGSICKDVEKIMQGNAYNVTQFSENSIKLTNSIDCFQKNFIPMMTQSTKYDFPLELNQFRYYKIVIENDSGNKEYADQTIIDAFFQFISTSKNYAAYKYTEVTAVLIKDMAEQNIFIQQNGKQLFVTISKKMSLQYLNLDRYLFDQHTTKQFILSMAYATNVVLALVFIAVLIKKINSFNESVVGLYNEIRLWDATQMKSKCMKFIEKNSTGIMKNFNSKRRVSTLLNVFPQQAFVQVIESAAQNQQNKENLKSHNHSNSSEDDFLLKPETASQMDEIKEGQMSRVSQRQRKFYVYLTEKNKLKRKFLFFGIIASLFIGAYFVEHYYSSQYEQKVLYYNQRISELGKVRNNLAFINYYTYELMLEPTDQTYRRLLKNQISEFYQHTDTCYDLIGDPSTILKDSYSLVEEVSALIFSNTLNITDAERYSIRNPKYILQEKSFEKNINQISTIIEVTLAETTDEIFSNIKNFKLAFVLIFILINLIFVLVIKCWMLEEILRNSRKSKSMIAMLPPWLIDRCKGISACFQ